MKLEKSHLAGIALCVAVVVQTGQIIRLSHLYADTRWRLDNMQLCHAVVEVQDSVTRERVTDVRLEYSPNPVVGVDRDDLMVVTQRHDNTLLVVWVGSGFPVRASAISDSRGRADFELHPGIANLVFIVNTNAPSAVGGKP